MGQWPWGDGFGVEPGYGGTVDYVAGVVVGGAVVLADLLIKNRPSAGPLKWYHLAFAQGWWEPTRS